jgi:acetate kinase
MILDFNNVKQPLVSALRISYLMTQLFYSKKFIVLTILREAMSTACHVIIHTALHNKPNTHQKIYLVSNRCPPRRPVLQWLVDGFSHAYLFKLTKSVITEHQAHLRQRPRWAPGENRALVPTLVRPL